MKPVRWKVVLTLAFAIFFSAAFGFAGGEKSQAYLAFVKRQYTEALRLYLAIGDDSGAGMTLLAQNKPDDAAKRFEKAGDESGLGLCALKKREYTAAIGHFIAKNDQKGLGLAYLHLRDEEKAREAFSKADDWSGLGLLHLSKSEYQKAEECFRKVRDLSGLGLTALKQKRFAEAEKYFDEAGDEQGLGLLALAKRDYDRAIVYFKKVNDLSGQAYVAMDRGDFLKAKELFIQANDQNGLGDLHSQLHEFRQAREAFENDHNAVKVIQSYRNDYKLKDRHRQALAYGEVAVKEGRMVPECLMEMADIYYELKEPEKGLALLDQAAAIKGYASEARLRKGRIYFYLRDLKNARQEFEAVKADDIIGEGLFKQAQDSLQTIATYEALLKNNPNLLAPAESF